MTLIRTILIQMTQTPMGPVTDLPGEERPRRSMNLLHPRQRGRLKGNRPEVIQPIIPDSAKTVRIGMVRIGTTPIRIIPIRAVRIKTGKTKTGKTRTLKIRTLRMIGKRNYRTDTIRQQKRPGEIRKKEDNGLLRDFQQPGAGRRFLLLFLFVDLFRIFVRRFA